jgi:hypothetical protein
MRLLILTKYNLRLICMYDIANFAFLASHNFQMMKCCYNFLVDGKDQLCIHLFSTPLVSQ